MGLDMFLHKRERINTYDFKQQGDAQAKKMTVKTVVEWEDGKTEEQEYTCEPQHSGYVYLPIAYWRKANEIHRWFLGFLDDGEEDHCQQIYVDGTHILELVDLCKQVLADHSKAQELLPTQEGFFFGSTEYDEWYFKDLENTIEMLKDIKPEDDFIYQASW